MPWLNFFVAGVILLKHPRKNIQKHIVGLGSNVWSTCHFWRKSRRKAWFLRFKASCSIGVSQKSFVLFWVFKASFLKEVSQKSFVFNFRASKIPLGIRPLTRGFIIFRKRGWGSQTSTKELDSGHSSFSKKMDMQKSPIQLPKKMQSRISKNQNSQHL